MKTLLATFGDSWTYGSELENPKTESWTAHVGADYTTVYNMGVPASSIGHLAVQLDTLLNKVDITKFDKRVFVFGLTSQSRYLFNDNVRNEFVNGTSEGVYRTQIQGNGRPPELVEYMSDFMWEYYRRIDSDAYQVQQCSQTVAFLQGWCLQNNVQDVYISYFENQNFNRFVNLDSIINAGLAIGLKYSAFSKHPDANGHKEIAKTIKDFICLKYPE